MPQGQRHLRVDGLLIDRFHNQKPKIHLRYVIVSTGCSAHELALVSNATTGMNAVFKSFPLEEGDVVLILDTAYGIVMSHAQPQGSIL